MINTNALLSIAFSLIASFTNNVPIPPDAAPASTEDLIRWVHGRPSDPLLLALFEKRGNHFWIRNGVVQGYESPNSYFSSRGHLQITNYFGTAILDSNQALCLATHIIDRLARGSNHLARVAPRVKHAWAPTNNPGSPIYLFTWPDTEHPGSSYSCAAEVEIDARRGAVLSLFLEDPMFFDHGFTQCMISNRVYVPDPTPPPPPASLPDRRYFPAPSTNEVRIGIANWQFLCPKLGIPLGEDRSLSRVDWDQSLVSTNREFARGVSVCLVQFTNGAWFWSVKGVVIACSSQDAWYSSSSWLTDAKKARLEGRVAKRWQDLAEAFEERLSVQLGVPQAFFKRFSPETDRIIPGMGTNGFTRCLVRWQDPKEYSRRVHGQVPRGELVAEFDLRCGETTFVAFYNSDLIAALARVQLGGRRGE